MNNRSASLSENPDQDRDFPPSYINIQSTMPTPEANILCPIANPLNIDFQNYKLPQSTVSEDQLTTTTTFPIFSSDAKVLVEVLRKQASLPPKPLVRIKGTHPEYEASWAPIKLDFDLTLNLMPLMRHAETHQGNYIKVVASGDSSSSQGGTWRSKQQNATDVEEWVQRFCDNPAEHKSFTLERTVTHWNTSYLEAQIRNLATATKYRGNLSVTFPIAHSKVTILHGRAPAKDKDPKPWKEKLLKKHPSGPQTQSYEVLQSVWPYASGLPGEGQIRHFSAQSEETWWQVWKAPIRNAMLEKRRGWVTVEDWTTAIMGYDAAERKEDWAVTGKWY